MDVNNQIKESYETHQLSEIAKWKTEEPSVLSKISGRLFKPVSWLVETVIPEKSVQQGIEACSGASKFLLDINGFKQETGITEIAELKQKPLHFCDAQADSTHNWAIGYAASEGAVTGVAGFAGMAADIPAIITIAFRTINKIGLCYGFENITEQDNLRILSILSVSGANTIEEKQVALESLAQLNAELASASWKQVTQKTVNNELSKEAGKIVVRGLARQLGINLTRRKTLQVIPVVGAAVAAGVNGAFVNDVAWAARRIFQEAWLNNKYSVAVNNSL